MGADFILFNKIYPGQMYEWTQELRTKNKRFHGRTLYDKL